MNYMEQYFTALLDGKINACDKMKRVSEMLLDQLYNPEEFHFDETIANRHVDFIEKFCKLPSGKANTQLRLELFQKARLQAIFGFVDDNNLRQYREALIIEGRKNGKALSLETEIPTVDGFKKMRDITLGDVVFSCDGTQAKVVLESEIFLKPMYEVKFEDGTTVQASKDHLWTVCSKYSKRRYREKRSLSPWIVVDTATMYANHVKYRLNGFGVEYTYRTPMPKAAEYNERDLLIDPYMLGFWLGDGDSGKSRLTVNRADCINLKNKFVESGYAINIVEPNDSNCGYVHVYVNKNKDTGKCLISDLRKLNLISNKHIPHEYMIASIKQRKELLKGLMDSDGYCSKDGQVELTQKRKELIIQVQELLASLGIKSSVREDTAKIGNKDCGKVYSVLFYTDAKNTCFTLERKTNRLKNKLSSRMGAKSIVSIKPIEAVPSKCIGIDHPSHMYLFGRNYTTTHNTTETAAVEIDLLVNDGEFSPQIYNIATRLEQAKLGFNACHKMVKQSSLLSKHIKKRASDLYFSKNYGLIKALASDSSGLDGLDVHGATIDELAAIKNRDIYDLIKQASGARKQPLLFTISTNGFVRSGIFDNQYDYASNILDKKSSNRRFLPLIYELDNADEWDREECWVKANPGLGTIKSIDSLREMVQKAKDDVSFKPTVLVKDFNLKQTGSTSWLRWEELNNDTMIPDYPFKYCIGGFDAADTIDLNAAKAIIMKPEDPHLYVKSMYWMPQRIIDEYEESGRLQGRDNVPYRLWKDKGYLRTVDTYKVDKKVFLEWFKELMYEQDIYTLYIGYDPWHIDDSLLREFKNEFGERSMVPIRQGAATLSAPMKELKADLSNKLIVYDNNPIDKWCLANVAVKTDVNGNIQPVKADDPRRRIDGALALIDAYVVYQDKASEFLTMI